MYQYNLIQYCNTLPFLFLFLFFQEVLPLWNLSRTSKFLGNFSSYSIFDRWRKKNKKKTPPHNQGWPCIDHLYLAVTGLRLLGHNSHVCNQKCHVWPPVLYSVARQMFSTYPNCQFAICRLQIWTSAPACLKLLRRFR